MSKEKLKGAITSFGAGTDIGALLVCGAYGIPWTTVTHEGAREARLSVIRGDTDFVVTSLDSSLS